jgi:hypothetical protein
MFARADRALHAGKEYRGTSEFSGLHLNARRNLASGLRTSDHDHAHPESPWSLKTWGQVAVLCEHCLTAERLLCGNCRRLLPGNYCRIANAVSGDL